MYDIAHVSASVEVTNGCLIECRANMKSEVEFSMGGWSGSLEMLFDRFALQRFTELAIDALSESAQSDPDNNENFGASPKNHTAHVSASVDVANGCPMEFRIDARGKIEFSLGTWKGSFKIMFDCFALKRFTELATKALNDPTPSNPDAARPVHVSLGTLIFPS